MFSMFYYFYHFLLLLVGILNLKCLSKINSSPLDAKK